MKEYISGIQYTGSKLLNYMTQIALTNAFRSVKGMQNTHGIRIKCSRKIH